MEKPFVLITGAGRGIGRAFADVFGENGYPLVLIDWDRQAVEAAAKELAAAYKVVCVPHAVDLATREGVERVICRADKMANIILVNNVGLWKPGYYPPLNPDQSETVLDLNVKCMVRLTEGLLPKMLMERTGGIINVGSMAHLLPGPHSILYTAGKSFTHSYTMSLAARLRKTRVRITEVCPPSTFTGEGRKLWFQVTAELVAEEAYHGFIRGKTFVYPGFYKLVVPFLPLIPWQWRAYAMKLGQEALGTASADLLRPGESSTRKRGG